MKLATNILFILVYTRITTLKCWHRTFHIFTTSPLLNVSTPFLIRIIYNNPYFYFTLFSRENWKSHLEHGNNINQTLIKIAFMI